MRAPAITVFLLLFSFSSAAAANSTDKILGLSEKVYIKELNTVYTAKIDTGAESVSINAINVRVKKGQGEEPNTVHFDLILPDNSLKSLSLPLKKHIRIQRRASDYSDNDRDYARRPVLDLTLCIGGQTRTVEANLADRREFSAPVLIGHELLVDFNALVDPSEKYLQDVDRCDIADDASR